jgi:hypothetical protein
MLLCVREAVAKESEEVMWTRRRCCFCDAWRRPGIASNSKFGNYEVFGPF